MRRALLLIALVALAACASSKVVPDDGVVRRVPIYSSRETGIIFGDRPNAEAVSIAAPPDAVWAAVRQTYADFDIPVTLDNRPAHQLGNANLMKSRQLAGRPMTEFVDCGNGPTGQKAATYRIYMTVVSQVTPDGSGGTLLRTTFAPMGQDISGTSSDRIPCGTTGHFEQYFIDHVAATLTKR